MSYTRKEARLKVMRLKTKTGELNIRKDVAEFFIGRLFFVWVFSSGEARAFENDNILSVELLTNGEFLFVNFQKK